VIIGQEINVCSSCGSKKLSIDEKRAEVYCRDCGNILDERLLWADLAENVVYNPKFRELFFVMPNELRNLDERALIRAYNDLILIDNLLNLRRYVRKEILGKYMRLFRNGLTERKSRMKILGAMVLMVCRRDGLPYLDSDVAFACYCDEKELVKTAKKVSQKLREKLLPKDPSILVLSVSSGIGMSEKGSILASSICDEIIQKKVMIHTKPESLAAASIIFSSRMLEEDIDEKRLLNLMKVSRSTS
jgi:transcription initiation factor TFIIIB Brf1 subunit/transcription initiation factor TFIIB